VSGIVFVNEAYVIGQNTRRQEAKKKSWQKRNKSGQVVVFLILCAASSCDLYPPYFLIGRNKRSLDLCA
jgi:hypothetical protein